MMRWAVCVFAFAVMFTTSHDVHARPDSSEVFAQLDTSRSIDRAFVDWALGEPRWPRKYPFDANADGVLSDAEEMGYGRIDTAPRKR